jgi:hypothetical protein
MSLVAILTTFSLGFILFLLDYVPLYVMPFSSLVTSDFSKRAALCSGFLNLSSISSKNGLYPSAPTLSLKLRTLSFLKESRSANWLFCRASLALGFVGFAAGSRLSLV